MSVDTLAGLSELVGYIVALIGAGLGLGVGVVKTLTKVRSRGQRYHPYEEARVNAKLNELIRLSRESLSVQRHSLDKQSRILENQSASRAIDQVILQRLEG